MDLTEIQQKVTELEEALAQAKSREEVKRLQKELEHWKKLLKKTWMEQVP
jgi:hypothetical protein